VRQGLVHNNTVLQIDTLPSIADALLVSQRPGLPVAFCNYYDCNQRTAGNNQELSEKSHAFMDCKRQIKLKNAAHRFFYFQTYQ